MQNDYSFTCMTQ